MEIRITTVDELKALAAQFVESIVPGKQAVIVALSGDLGAGKTTFVQAAAEVLEVREDVTSPTFVIEKIYQLTGQKFQRLIHIDAYRLESSHELEVLGFEEFLKDPGNLILLEWPEKVSELIPSEAVRVRFDIHGDERTISINGGEENKKESRG